MRILTNGAEITEVTPGSAPVYVPGFALTAAPALTVQGLPGDWLQIRSEGDDVGNARPAVLNIVGDSDTVMVTRGAGENAHVVTVRALSTCVFLDTFSGTSVSAELHSPDVAPAGFAYAQIGFGPNTTLEINGSGRLVGVDNGVSTAGVIDQSASSTPPDLSVTIPYAVRTTLRPSAALDDSLVFVEFNDAADRLNTRIFVGIARSGLGEYELQVEVENYSEGTGDGYAFLYHPLPDGAERSIAVSVTGTSFSVSIDGGAGIDASIVGTESLPTAFTGLRFLVDTNSPFSADNSYIDSVALCHA